MNRVTRMVLGVFVFRHGCWLFCGLLCVRCVWWRFLPWMRCTSHCAVWRVVVPYGVDATPYGRLGIATRHHVYPSYRFPTPAHPPTYAHYALPAAYCTQPRHSLLDIPAVPFPPHHGMHVVRCRFNAAYFSTRFGGPSLNITFVSLLVVALVVFFLRTRFSRIFG